MNWDGTGKVLLTQNPWRSGYPSWSFDGRFIFFEAYKDGDWEIYRINSDGSDPLRLTLNASAYDWHPSGHPFKNKLFFESGSTGNEDIYIMDHDGENIEKISSKNMRKRVPVSAKDGSLIVFMGYEGKKTIIYTMDSNGENIIGLTSPDSNFGHPDISPDSEFIVVEGIVDGQEEIFIMNLDGSGPIRLTDNPGEDWDPVFMYQLP